MEYSELREILSNAKSVVKENLADAIRECESRDELHDLARLAHEIDSHDWLGRVIAKKAQELDVDEIYVGEYDKDGQYLKIREVHPDDDYYGYNEVSIGQWVSSSY